MIKKHAVTLGGLAIMVGAFAWNNLAVDETVPNDANIGDGLLFLVGIGVVIAGLAIQWNKRQSGPTPPPPSDTSATV